MSPFRKAEQLKTHQFWADIEILAQLKVIHPKKVREGFRMNMYNTELGAGAGKESGVSELQIFENQVFGQRKPEAKFFKRWITHEVIPAIRKHGAYMTDSVLQQVMENPETIYTLAEQLLVEKEKNREISRQLKMAQPKANYFDTFVNSMDCTCIRYCGKELGVPQNMFAELMRISGSDAIIVLAKEIWYCIDSLTNRN